MKEIHDTDKGITIEEFANMPFRNAGWIGVKSPKKIERREWVEPVKDTPAWYEAEHLKISVVPIDGPDIIAIHGLDRIPDGLGYEEAGSACGHHPRTLIVVDADEYRIGMCWECLKEAMEVGETSEDKS